MGGCLLITFVGCALVSELRVLSKNAYIFTTKVSRFIANLIVFVCFSMS